MDESIKRIAKHYGYDSQKMILMEEMGELTQAIVKHDRTEKEEKDATHKILIHMAERNNIIEEISDVEIMLAQMKYFYSCEGEVNCYVNNKLNRQIDRIEREKRGNEPVNVIYGVHSLDNPQASKKFIWRVPVNTTLPSVGEVVKVNCLGGVKNVLVTGIATLPRCEAYSHKTMIGKVFGDEQQE